MLKSGFFSKNRESIKQGRRGQRNTRFFFGFLYVTGSAGPRAWICGALNEIPIPAKFNCCSNKHHFGLSPMIPTLNLLDAEAYPLGKARHGCTFLFMNPAFMDRFLHSTNGRDSLGALRTDGWNEWSTSQALQSSNYILDYKV